MPVFVSSVVRRVIAVLLIGAFVLLACFSSISPIGPQPAEAQWGEFGMAAIMKLLGGIWSKELDNLFSNLNDNGPDVEKILDEINEAIQNVSAEIQATEAQLRNIFAELMEMEFYQLVLNATDAASEIETYWNDEYVPRFCNKQAGTVPEQTFQDFMNACKGTTASPPLEYDFNMIRDVLCHNDTSRGAMDQYTDMVMSQIAASDVQDFSTTVESTNGVGIVVERPIYFDYHGKRKGGSVQSGDPSPQKEYYFAEGTTRQEFDSYLCVQNPGGETAEVNIAFMRGDTSNMDLPLSVAPHSRATVNAGDVLGHADGQASDFSAHVTSKNGVPVVGERAMYFNFQGAWEGGHCNLGHTQAAGEFYLAEGTCRNNFETFVCIQNPGDAATSVRATYLRGDGSSAEQSVVVPSRSRATLRPSDVMGHGDGSAFDFSSRVETLDGGKIVVERPIYFNYRDAWSGGHCESGRVTIGDDFYFAEGCVRPSFHSYICMVNPGAAPSDVKVTFHRGDGTTKETTRVIAPHTRDTLNVSDVLGSGDGPAYDFSCRVNTTDGSEIGAERAMYFDYLGPRTVGGPGWPGGHCEIGLTQPGEKFYFAEGTVRPGFSPYVCIQNPSGEEAEVMVTYMKSDGGVMSQSLTVGPHTRSTIDVAQAWNTLQVSGSGGGNDALVHAYMGLEQLFSKFLHDQVMAVDMICEVMNYEDPSGNTSSNYLSGTVAPAIQKEVRVFLDNAERLVMSQAYLDMEPGKNVLALPDEGQEVLDRANFVVNMVYRQAVVAPGPVLQGRVITTNDINSAGAIFPLTARDKSTGKELTPGDVWAVPASTSSNPYYPTVWRKVTDTGEIKNNFYDSWDSSLQTVDYSSALSVTRYTFSGADIVNGHSYDILDANDNVLATATVTTYDDEFNQSDTGDNTWGGFEVTMGKNGDDAFLDKTGWSETKSESAEEDYQEVFHSYDFTPTTQKWVETGCAEYYDQAPGDFNAKTSILRTFKAASSASAAVHYDASVNGELSCSLYGSKKGSQTIEYIIELDDTTAGSTVVTRSGSLTQDYDHWEDFIMYLNEAPVGDLSVSLIAGHTYALSFCAHVDVSDGNNKWAPIDHWIKVTVNNSYITYLQDQ